MTLSQEIIRSGQLGDIYFITTSRVNLGRTNATSALSGLASRLLHPPLLLEEVPTRVSAVSRSCVVEGTADVAFIDLEYASELSPTWRSPGSRQQTAPDRVVGSEQMLISTTRASRPFGSLTQAPASRTPRHSGNIASVIAPATSFPPVKAHEPLSLELTDFCGAVRTGRSRAPRPSLAWTS